MEKRRFRNRNKPRRRRFYKRKGFWLTLLLLGAIGCGFGWVAFDYYTKPYRERAEVYDLSKINQVEVPSLILDREGREVGRIFVQNRSVIGFSEIPENMIGALKSGEDRRFDSHNGVDFKGIVRAGYENWKAGEPTQGGSTITQQLARGAFDLQEEARKRQETPYERKLVEAFLAIRIEDQYEKWEILEFYLNRIYFGSGFYGLRSASLGYFGKEPKQLTDLECATLVGLIKRPNDLSPLNNPEACRRARNMVLDRMLEDGRVSAKDHKEWREKPVSLSPEAAAPRGPATLRPDQQRGQRKDR
jgi:membrane peptidoglycan carboxypeptidase